MTTMDDFADFEVPVPSDKDFTRRLFQFPNGREVSVICGPGAYGSGNAPFEVFATDAAEPVGWQTETEVCDLLVRVANMW